MSIDPVPGAAPDQPTRALLLRRWWPLPLFALAVAACGLSIALGAAQVPLAVLLGLATYPMASRLPKMISFPAALMAGVVIAGTLVSASSLAWQG